MAGEDRDYVSAVHGLPCAARHLSPCHGRIEADHAGRRGLSQRAHDRTCIPLCTLHHRQRHDASGPFRSMDRETLRDWLITRIAETRALLELNTCDHITTEDVDNARF